MRKFTNLTSIRNFDINIRSRKRKRKRKKSLNSKTIREKNPVCLKGTSYP